jgi:hypothetical protein
LSHPLFEPMFCKPEYKSFTGTQISIAREPVKNLTSSHATPIFL